MINQEALLSLGGNRVYIYQLISKLPNTYITITHPTKFTEEEFLSLYNKALKKLGLSEDKNNVISEVSKYLVEKVGFSYLSVDIKLFNDKDSNRLATEHDIVDKGIIDIS